MDCDLSHPNIPKPLHGVNPRSIMGQKEWDRVRKEAYASTNYHCHSCGVHKSEAKKHKWLEAHESYQVDYKKKTVTVLRIIPLCHYCHSFIHSGLLRARMDRGDITRSEVVAILNHGISLIKSKSAPIFIKTHHMARGLGVDVSGLPIIHPPASPDWRGWVMVWGGQEYPAKFQSFEQWQVFYNQGAG